MGITVRSITYLLQNFKEVWVFVFDKTYSFKNGKIPDEICDLAVFSIDAPEFYDEVHPLIINIDIEDIENINEFQETYSEYEI